MFENQKENLGKNFARIINNLQSIMAERSKYTVISTKIPPLAKEKLIQIAQGWNLSCYELFQALLLVIIRYFDKETTISEEMNTVVQAFLRELSNNKKRFNPLAIKSHKEEKINKAIFFATTKENQTPQLIAIKRDGNGNFKENYNIDDMLSMFLNSYDPKILKLLKNESKKKNNFGLAQTLHELIVKGILADNKENIEDEIRSMFSDVRLTTGQKINDSVFYKQKKNIGDYTQIETYKHQNIRTDI